MQENSPTLAVEVITLRRHLLRVIYRHLLLSGMDSVDSDTGCLMKKQLVVRFVSQGICVNKKNIEAIYGF